MAGRIPQHFIDTLIARVNIVDVIDARLPLSKKGSRDYTARCPFHEEKTPSFTVSEAKQFYHCFGCGVNGTAIGFLMAHDHRTFPEAVEELASLVGLEIPRDGAATPQANQVSNALVDIVVDANAYFQKQLREHRDAHIAIDYLKDRGVSGQTAAEFGIGFAPESWDGLVQALDPDNSRQKLLDTAGLVSRRDSGGVYDRFRGRIIFPIEDHRGRVVGFGGRVFDDSEPKYLNSPETPLFRKRAELYGLHRARGAIKEATRAFVVEGYMDVVALAEFGINNAVATLGTATTPIHLERLFRFADEIIFCFDGDNAGRRAAWKALQESLPLMQDGRQIGFLFLPEGDDPDSIVRREGPAGFHERATAAVPLPDFMLRELASQTDLSRLDGQARLVELARPMIEKLPDGLFRDMMTTRLADAAAIDSSVVDRRLGRYDNENRRPQSPRNRPANRSGRPSREPVSQAITLLLRFPELALCEIDYSTIANSNHGGIEMLLELVQEARSTPGLTAAVLIERFREHRYHKRLEELVSRPQILTDGKDNSDIDIESEYRGLVAVLARQAFQRRFDELQQAASAGDNSAGELSELISQLPGSPQREDQKP